MEILGLEEIDSTNNYAKINIEKLADRTVVHAKSQTSGRGRLNRKWVDLGEGNLFMSIVLKPSDKYLEVYSNLTQYLSLVLCKVLETYGLKPQIKWPNDVLINGKKIAGILSETVMQGANFKGLVLGIGVNLKASQQEVEDIPDRIATSLNLELARDISLEDFRNNLLEEFFKNYEKFIENGFSKIKEEYLSKNCFLNKEVNIQVFNEIKSGLAKGVNDNGALILQTATNDELVLTIGDIL